MEYASNITRDARDMRPYIRELGLSANYAVSDGSGYPSYMKATVIDVDPRYMPHDSILGMTDLKIIWLRNDLGADRDEVLHHERVHIRYPAAMEYRVRQITRSERIAQGKPCRIH